MCYKVVEVFISMEAKRITPQNKRKTYKREQIENGSIVQEWKVKTGVGKDPDSLRSPLSNPKSTTTNITLIEIPDPKP